MVKHFHSQQVRWLWWLALLFSAAGGATIYVLSNERPDPDTRILMSLVVMATFLSVGICVICATAHLWMSR